MQPYDELQMRVEAALAEIRLDSAPGSHSPADTVTELRIQPTGEVVVRVGKPVDLATFGEPTFPMPVSYATGYSGIAYGSGEPTPWTPPVQSIEPPAFSADEEALLRGIQSATGLSREQLLGHLLGRVLGAEARQFASEQGLAAAQDLGAGEDM